MERKYLFVVKLLLTAAAAGMLLSVIWLFSMEHIRLSNDVKKIEFIGSYRPSGDEEWTEWNSSVSIDNIGSPLVELKGHFDQDIPKDVKLRFYFCYIGLELYQNGTLIGAMGTPESLPPYAKSIGNGWLSLLSPGISSEDEITMVLSCNSKANVPGLYDYLLNEIYTGDSGELFLHYMPAEGPLLAAGVAIVLLAAVMAIVWFLLKMMKIPTGKAPMYAALYLISQGTWLMLYSGIITLLLPYHIALNFVYMLASAGMAFFAFGYLLDFVQGRSHRVFRGIGCIFILMVFACAVLQLTGRMDSYEASQLFLVCSAPVVCSCAVCLTVQMARGTTEKNWGVMVIVYIYAVCQLAEVVNAFLSINSETYGVIVGIFIFGIGQFVLMLRYLYANYRQAMRAREMEKELVQAQMSVMVSQIQPHFLYNVLTSIAMLCEKEPARAKEAIITFSVYLRGNMESLKQTRPIPFERELQHVKTYLDLEKMRFGDRLRIIYRIEVSEFFVPALTVQPIVENAVKHGAGKRTEGGTVTLSASEDPDAWLITVSDDGVGFCQEDVLKDGRSHLGLENVRTRLAVQCGGSLEIHSEKGVGTTVAVRIPKGD